MATHGAQAPVSETQGLETVEVDLEPKTWSLGNGNKAVFEGQRLGEQSFTRATSELLNEKVGCSRHGVEGGYDTDGVGR